MAKAMAFENISDIEAELNAPDEVLKAVKQIPIGNTFSANDIQEALDMIPHPQARGGVVQSKEFKQFCEWAGYTKSRKTGGIINLWLRVETQEEKEESHA